MLTSAPSSSIASQAADKPSRRSFSIDGTGVNISRRTVSFMAMILLR